MKKHLFVLLFLTSNLLLATCNLYSQPVTQQWVSRYQRTTNSPAFANYMALDKLGNCYVCGTVFDPVTRNDIVLIKYNDSGDTVWTRRYNNNNNEDFPAGVVVDSIGNAYITASTEQGSGSSDFLTLKYSPTGAQLWTRFYGNSGASEGPNDIKLDKNGNNIYVTGTNGTSGIAVTIKYNSNGDSLWTRTKQQSGYKFYGSYIALDNNNYIYTAIIQVQNNTNLDQFLVVKYDSLGIEQWTATHVNNSGFDFLVGIALDFNGNSFIAGGVNGHYKTVSFGINGIEQWAQTYIGPGNQQDNPSRIATDAQGNVIVTGYSTGVGTGIFDYATIKYNPLGDSLWVQRYNGPGNSYDYSYALALDDSDNVYVAGSSIGAGTNRDYATIKYNVLGIQQWIMRYNNNPPGNAEDIGYCIALDKSRNVYVTGVSDEGGLLFDYATIKYSQPVNEIHPISNNIPSEYRLFQNYPNPFNPSTKIRFQITSISDVKLVVYDILGSQIAKVVDNRLPTGVYETTFDGSMLASGVYFYRMTANSELNNFTDVKKLILVK